MNLNFFRRKPVKDRHARGDTKKAEEKGFLYLREGGYDHELDKQVRKIIFVEEKQAVYLDTRYDVQWLLDRDDLSMSEFGKVQTEVTYLELESSFLSGEKRPLLHVRSLLGEAYARVMQTGDAAAADAALAYARRILDQKNPDVSYGWYFGTTAWVGFGAFIAGFSLWLARRTEWISHGLGPTAFEILMCAIAGGLGALLSVAVRANNLKLNAVAGPRAHRYEALGRILVGMASASLLVLALKSRLFLAPLAIGSGHWPTLLLLSGLAGLSERVIPSLVSRFDTAIHTGEASTQGKATVSSSGAANDPVASPPPASGQDTSVAAATAATPAANEPGSTTDAAAEAATAGPAQKTE
ncbi:hypothetical protein AB3X91_33830 [Paraburkholderia sp. BR14263]|uniref:hypothetical protein n=1 Tax=unclassified Paraburkholderia TaxID=2615204 RepID=UPI0034CEB6F2